MTELVESYPIGRPGQPWNEQEKLQWREAQSVKRSYQEFVVAEITRLDAATDTLTLVQYGALPYNEHKYPLYLFRSTDWNESKPIVVVTGGVHGYETSGVHGALRFVESELSNFAEHFNFIVAPCISPWGYETINRWNPNADDPNRSFFKDTPAPESGLIMQYLADNNIKPLCHIDLHETTDTDNTEFRPALAARDAIEQKTWNIPDGFYGVGDSERPEPDFQKAVIDSVQKVTHIAPADDNGELIGVPMTQFGVINYPCKSLHLCAGMTDAKYVTTTEVYPDSPKVDDENCILAQVAAISGGLHFILKQIK
jgi:hypothetical protein